MSDVQERSAVDGVTFGAWLVKQAGRDGWTGDLGKAAKADRSFPREGNPDDVRDWLKKQRASGDDWEALEDAERDWLCY
jgi:hypothetical protein